MLVRYKPIIRSVDEETLFDAYEQDGEIYVTVVKSFKSFKEAKAFDGCYFADRKIGISEAEISKFITDKEAEKVKSAAEAVKNEALDYLKETDYVVIKIAEGVATKEEYATVLSERAAKRAVINNVVGAEEVGIDVRK